MSEQDLINTRKAKHQEINGSTYPLPHMGANILRIMDLDEIYNEFDTLIPTSLNLEEFVEDSRHRVRVCGRVRLFRKSGSIAFITLGDQTGTTQLIFSKAVTPAYDKIKLIDLGDIIDVVGYLCYSKTGERSILILRWDVLTKATRPMPEKFAGITDAETKYRKRYLDLISSDESRSVFMARSGIVAALRRFMSEEAFMEVETSTLNSVVSGANAKPFSTHHNALDSDLYLRIAPELYLKRLLVGGFDRIFEIGRNYRNEGIDTRHNPEFTMMEYYQAYGTFRELITRTKNMLKFIDKNCTHMMPRYVIKQYAEWKDTRSFTLEQFAEIPMWDAIINATGKAGVSINPGIHPLVSEVAPNDLPDIMVHEPGNERLSKIDMKGLLHDYMEATTVGHKIGVLFEYFVEPFLTEDYRTVDDKYSLPVFITSYPKELSPLARSNDKAPTLTDRFELFIEGRELANAFQELNDPNEQAARFKEQLKSNNKDPMDFDADYIESLEYGMPPAIGFGIGIDRLVMLLTNRQSIRDVILFPTLKTDNE
jgi:lysyl-tRNA synthetase class 2